MAKRVDALIVPMQSAQRIAANLMRENAVVMLAQRKVRAVTQAELGEELQDEPEDVEVAP